MNDVTLNPRALNIDAIYDATRKVTLGFKCEPELKIKLAAEAEEVGLTLSSYVEALLSDDSHQSKIDEAAQLIKELATKVSFYENDPIVQNLYNESFNKTIKFKNSKGENVQLKVETPEHILTILINSFKTKKND